MLSKNRGKILAFIHALDDQPHIILLSEIGREGYRYVYNTFPDYNNELDLPITNTYGGIAILAKKDIFTMESSTSLKMSKKCDCRSCQFENVWTELSFNNE